MRMSREKRKSLITGILASLLGIFLIYIYINDFIKCDCSFMCFCGLAYAGIFMYSLPFQIILLVLCIKNLKEKFNIFSILGIVLLLCPMAISLWNSLKAKAFAITLMVIVVSAFIGYNLFSRLKNKVCLVILAILFILTYGVIRFQLSDKLMVFMLIVLAVLVVMFLFTLNKKKYNKN